MEIDTAEIPDVMPAPELVTDDATGATGEAPFGYTKEGKPRKSRAGRPAKPRTTTSGPGRSTGPTMPTPSKTRPSTARRTVDYRAGLRGLVQVIALPLTFVSPLDAAAVLIHGDPLVEAINETAADRPEVAALCEKLLRVGPYGLVINACLGLGAQIAANHGWLPPALTSKLGALSPEELQRQMGHTVAQHEAAQAERPFEDVPFPTMAGV